MVGTTVSHYTVLEKLGEGGMGVVYKAIDTRLERFVALKFLPDDYAHDEALRDRFLREARAASALNHPNLCTIYDVGEDHGKIFIAMEFLDGVTLKELVWRGPLSYDRLLDIAVDVTDGLEAAHSAGVIHRDIKLANIFVTNRGRTKVLDFGLAKKTAPKPAAVVAAGGGSSGIEDTHMTSGLAALGTAAYMSPEQALGKPLDERTDLFSFGIVLYEMATGQAPFKGDTTGVLFLSIVQETPEPPRQLNPDVPDELQRIIGRCLEKDRGVRYQHASEIRADLQRLRIVSDSHKFAVAEMARGATASGNGDQWKRQPDSKPSWPSLQEPPTSAPSAVPESKPRRRGKTVAGAATLLLAVLVAGGLYFHSRKAHAFAAQSSIIIADFANTTGDQVFDGTLRQALAIDLAQSPYVNVVGDRRITAALKQMEKPVDTRLSHEVAREVCLRTNSKAYVAGSIAQEGDKYQLQLETLDCETGQTIASIEREAAGRNGVIGALNSADDQLRRELGESLSSRQRFNKPLAEATTTSLEALQAFTTGQTLRQQQGSLEALPYLKRAVEIDPNFAMAYAALGATYANTDEAGLSRENLLKAFALRNRVSEWERFYIEVAYHANFGDTDKTVRMCNEWISTYPADFYPRVRLAAQYVDLGRYQQAAEQLREAIRLAPDNYVPYVNLFEIYLGLKRPDEARATLEAAQAQHLSNENLLVSRYQLAFADVDTAAMQHIVDSAKGKPGFEDILLQYAAETEAFYGRLEKSRSLWQEAESAALAAGAQERAALYYASQAWIEAEFGNAPLARKFAAQALSMSHGREVVENAAFALARAGDLAQATQLADELNRQYPQYSLVQHYSLPSIRALIQIEQGRAASAVEVLNPAQPYELSQGSISDLRPAYIRGLAYLQMQRGADAAREFEKVIDNPGVVLNSIVGSLSYLQLARAEEMMGHHDAARTRYQDFLALWKDADPDIPILKQAKAEYAKLNEAISGASKKFARILLVRKSAGLRLEARNNHQGEHRGPIWPRRPAPLGRRSREHAPLYGCLCRERS